jgi:hypothetical protein
MHGSVSAELSRRSPCPVVVVPGSEPNASSRHSNGARARPLASRPP